MLKKLFGIDGNFTTVMGKVADLFLASVLWLVCSLPLVTIVLSSSALYYAVVKCVRRDRGTVTKEFLAFVKGNWKQGLLLGVLYLAIAALVVLNIFSVSKMDRDSTLFAIYSVEALWVALCFVFLSIYLFPVFSRFEYRTWECVKTSILISWKHVFSSLLMSVVAVPLLYFSVRYLFFLVIIPGFLALILSLRIEKILRKYMPEPKEGEPLAWYYDEKEAPKSAADSGSSGNCAQ